jgi:drug/metabolite transporter (DMT)-like permease
MDWKYVALLTLASFVTVAGQVVLKQSMAGKTELVAYLNPGFFLGLGTYAAGALIWVFCLSRVPLLRAYPFSVLTLVLAVLAGVLIMKEAAAPTYWVGLVFILFGLALVSM